MTKIRRNWGLAAVAIALLFALAPQAEAITIVDLGTAAPPLTVGGITMTPFGDDGRVLFANENDVPSPLGGVVGFSNPLSHRKIGSGWATWSHGYTGDVYYSNGLTTISLSLPAGTSAFYFYAEPNPFTTHQFTITANDGTFVVVDINGNAAANGFGLYGAGLSGVTIASNIDFAVGEFGIAAAVPEPSTVILLGAGLAALGYRRFRRS